jgi:O-antigen/teichoic acid export membrane protein
MALTEIEPLPARNAPSPLPARLRSWLASEHSGMQRMAGTAFAIRVVSAGVVFLSQIVLARWMGGFEYGNFVYVWTWLLLIGDLAHLGLPLTAQRNIPEYTQRKSFDRLRGYLIGSRWITFAASSAMALLGALLVHAIEASLDRHVIMPLYLACVALPFYSLSFMLDGIARSYHWIALALVPHSLLRPLMLIALMAAIHAVGLPVNATTTMMALAFAIWTTALLQLVVLARRLAVTVEPGPRTYESRNWLVTAMPMLMVWGCYTLLTCTDVLVLQQFRPAEETAHYYAAGKTVTLVTFVYFAVSAAAAHRFTAYHVAGDRDGLTAFAATTVRWTFWPSLAATLLILALGKPLLWLFGPGFDDAYPVMFILALGLLARAAVGPAERLVTMLGQQRICALAYTAACAANLLGCVLLAGPLGGIGVAIATAAAFVIESALLFLIAKRRLGLHLLIWQPRPKQPLAAA